MTDFFRYCNESMSLLGYISGSLAHRTEQPGSSYFLFHCRIRNVAVISGWRPELFLHNAWIFSIPRIAVFVLFKILIRVVALSKLFHFIYSFNSKVSNSYLLWPLILSHTSLWLQGLCSLISCFNPIAFYFESISVATLSFFLILSLGFGSLCLSCVDTYHCWYLTDHALWQRESLPQIQWKWSGVHFLSELIEMITDRDDLQSDFCAFL